MLEREQRTGNGGGVRTRWGEERLVIGDGPVITKAVYFTYSRGGEPFITFSVKDPKDHAVDDLHLTAGGKLRVEHQVETFYDRRIAPWFQLNGDLQMVRPDRPSAGTTAIPEGSLRIVF